MTGVAATMVALACTNLSAASATNLSLKKNKKKRRSKRRWRQNKSQDG